MSVASAEFLVAVLLLSAFFFRLPSALLRRALLAACNVGFLALFLPNIQSTVALAIFLLSGYFAAILLQRHWSSVLFTAYLVSLVGVFVVLKKYEFLPRSWLEHPISIIGLSYMLFRQIHFLVDVVQDQIERPTLWSYLNFQLNFLTLLSGPIDRFPSFKSHWDSSTPVLESTADLVATFQRLFLGILKVSLIAALCLSWFDAAMGKLDRAAAGDIPMTRLFGLRFAALAFYAYPAYVYFNFSGYCDIVIAAGRLLAQRIPENFDRPYLSRNTIDFWTRQHMTLSFWIRDYVFTPLYKAIAERWPRAATIAVYPCYFVAFFLAGVWHGSTFNWVIFGMLHGAGVSAAKLWETFLTRRWGRKGFKEYLQNRAIRIAAIVMTLNFLCFTFIFFTPDLEHKWTIAKAIWHALAHGGTT